MASSKTAPSKCRYGFEAANATEGISAKQNGETVIPSQDSNSKQTWTLGLRLKKKGTKTSPSCLLTRRLCVTREVSCLLFNVCKKSQRCRYNKRPLVTFAQTINNGTDDFAASSPATRSSRRGSSRIFSISSDLKMDSKTESSSASISP